MHDLKVAASQGRGKLSGTVATSFSSWIGMGNSLGVLTPEPSGLKPDRIWASFSFHNLKVAANQDRRKDFRGARIGACRVPTGQGTMTRFRFHPVGYDEALSYSPR